jgi:amino-acid N-acetyltransferase
MPSVSVVAADVAPVAVASEHEQEAADVPDDQSSIEQVRRGRVADVPAIARLITANLAAGHLLPRSTEDLTARAERFLVVTVEEDVVGCAELAPLSRAVAEVRSLVVDERCRGRGLGSRLVEELQSWARRDGFSTLCAFTHHPSHFIRLGFSMVPHPWLPEKLATDCYGCPKFRSCGQYAMVLALKGGSVRTSAAGQRPYQAIPPGIELKLIPLQPQTALPGQARQHDASRRIASGRVQ